MSTPPLYEDARWPAFIARYANDLCAFAADVLGMEVTPELARTYCLASLPGCRVSIATDIDLHGCDAISPMAPIALWRLLCWPQSQTLVVTRFGRRRASKQQYERLLTWMVDGAHSWLRAYITVDATHIQLRRRYAGAGILFLCADQRSPESLAGHTGGHVCWLMEDAEDIPDVCFCVAGASMTDPGASMVLTNKPWRESGYAALTRGKLSKDQGGPWDVCALEGTQSGR
ncbi:hypothetical protein [Pseudomonas sp. UMAB-40]|uniref:hypothetical protein n=1 Tax=Pseudomonas sp. UMAB-40 TaxID=1365407 RepID=UPI001C564FBF|nr:hypothetical protein [Pseudomonas sp. UMAB-40]